MHNQADRNIARNIAVLEQDYLLYQQLYRREIYEQYSDGCTDTKVTIFRKCAG